MSQQRSSFSRSQRLGVIYGMISFILITVVCQLWLVTATVNGVLGGDDSIAWPAAVASLLCLASNVGLLRYIYSIEKSA